ncbi:MAG: histidine kinase, partial [Ferruginibacter sp.]
NGTFYNYNQEQTPESISITGVTKFIEDGNNNIWLEDKHAFYKLNNNSNQFENYNTILGIATGSLPEFLEKDNKGNLWFVTTAGIKCYNPAAHIVYDKNNNPRHLKVFDANPDFTTFLISGDQCWIGVRNRKMLLRYNLSTNTVSSYSFENISTGNLQSKNTELNTANLNAYADHSLFVDLIGEGIALYDPAKDSFTVIPVKNSDPNGLHANPESFWGITSLKDRDGNIWITSDDMDLNVFNPSREHFNFYGTHTSHDKKTIAGFSVNGFIQDPRDNDIYICYYDPAGGIERFSSGLNLKKKYLFNKGSNINSLENQLWCLFQDEEGIIWAPNQAKTILKLDPLTDRLTLMNDSSLYGNINTISKDKNADVWLGCWSKGLKKIDRQTQEVVSFPMTVPGSTAIAKNVKAICFDGDSIIWAGTNGQGLFRFDKRLNSYTNVYLFDEKKPFSVSSNIIKKIIAYNDDTLLLATAMGVNLFDKKKNIFSSITTKDGLPGNLVETFALDDRKNLWTACDGGFSRINMRDLSITRYGISDGITDNNFSDASCLKLKDGKFLVSANKGFIAFDPAEIIDAVPSVPVITGFKVFERQVKIDSVIDAGSSIILSYRDNSIAIEFTSLQFNFSDELKYYYRLEGADKAWILSDKTQSAHYNQLQDGDYMFKVKAVNRDGVVSSLSLPVHIIITAPFWKTWWFRLLIAIMAVVLIYWFLQTRIKAIRAKEKVKEQITALEIKALKAQMNPHFIFNAMNSIQEFTLTGEVDKANKYISRFSRLLRKVLHQSEQNSILVSDEIETLQLYLEIEKGRLGKDFIYRINVDNETEAQMISIPSMLLQPFVENALQHGLANKEGEKILELNFKMPDDETLICEIIDNGIGRAQAAVLKKNMHPSLQHQSLGIELVKERLQLLSRGAGRQTVISIEDLVTDSGEPAGTKVIISIPQL